MSEETGAPERVEHKTLALALAAAFIDVDGYVQKTGNHQQGYTFASDADLINCVRPALAKHGLVILPKKVTTTTEPCGESRGGKKQFLTRATCEYTLLHAESGESQPLGMAGAGMGGSDADKATYKAETGAYKYVLRELFMLATGDDPENPNADDNEAPSEEIQAAFNRGAAKGREWVIRQQYTKGRDDFDGRAMARMLKDKGAPNLEDVRHFRMWMGRDKLSLLEPEKREAFVEWLVGDSGQKKFDEFVKACGV